MSHQRFEHLGCGGAATRAVSIAIRHTRFVPTMASHSRRTPIAAEVGGGSTPIAINNHRSLAWAASRPLIARLIRGN
jgi:hypothetical protein